MAELPGATSGPAAAPAPNEGRRAAPSRWVRPVLLLAACVLLLFMLRRFEHNQVYHPSRSFRATGTELNRGFEDIWLTASDGVKLNAWFYPAATNAPRAHLAFLVCHGNAGNIGDRLDVCSTLLQTGANVLLFDYRGYGRSEGRPSEEGTYLDAEAAHAWLDGRGFAPQHIVAYGESLGGAVAAELALRRPVGALVLQSTFTSIVDIGAELFPWLPVRWLSRINYDTHSKLSKITVPALILHSRQDSLIGFQHAERNFAAANEPKFLWEIHGDHNDGIVDPSGFLNGIQQVLTLLPQLGTDQPALPDGWEPQPTPAR